MSAAPALIPLTREALFAEARRRAGLQDFDEQGFFKPFIEPMEMQLKDMRETAQLSPGGHVAQSERILAGLVNVLRMVDDLKKHPEIRQEKTEVAAIVAGLARTGSTMLHRLLANHSSMTAPIWWEVTYFAPFPGEKVNGDLRKEAARAQVKWMCDNMPDLISIHPMDADQPDEEVIAMEQLFVGTAAEAQMYLPNYVAYLEQLDMHPIYEFLRLFLQYLQWQEPSRRGKKWVLKAPCHLTGLKTMLEVFPEAKVIMTHRDPVATIPSFASFCYTLCKLASDHADPKYVGPHWSRRWGNALKDFLAVRAANPKERFIDVMYEQQIKDPVGVAMEVYRRMGLPTDDQTKAQVSAWIAENGRDKRAPHKYSIDTFGLTEEGLKKDYAFYREAFGFK